MKDNKYHVWLYYVEYTEGGEICEGQEDDDWPSYEPEYKNFEPKYILAKEASKISRDVWPERITIDFNPYEHNDKVFMVTARYSSGCTFGNNYGNWEIVGLYKTLSEAAEVEKSIRDDTYTGDKAWEGYFEELENVEIFTTNIIK